jgi:hypothetical protein
MQFIFSKFKVSSHTTVILGYCARIYTLLTIVYYKGGKSRMTNRQRMKSDIATIDRREMTDKTTRDNRIRNDKITGERRFKADKTVEKSRLRNDEITANRREIKDGNMNTALAISLLILIVLAVGAYFVFI